MAVVVCNSLGAEAHIAKLAIRRLCEELSDVGATSLRFDYDGTGDSAGELDDPDRVPAWLASIEAAIGRVRDLGFDRVALVGIRMGALLAAYTSMRRKEADILVMWDPCVSTTAFMREQRLLFEFRQLGETVTSDSTEGLSYVFSSETIADLDALRPPEKFARSSRRVLVLTRTGKPILHDGGRWVGRSGVSFRATMGQEELLNRRIEDSALPDSTINEIVNWIKLNASPLFAASRDEVEHGPEHITLDIQGKRVIESPLFAGKNRLFGMLTEPSQSSTVTFVFLSMGRLDHVGPGRLWTNLSRDFASRGFRCLRLDGSGIGESNRRQGISFEKSKSRLDDLRDVVRTLGEKDASSFVLIGVSSGGYHASVGALRLGPAGICLINPALSAEMRDIWRSSARHKPLSLQDSLATLTSRRSTSRWFRHKYLQLKIRTTAWVPIARAGRRCVPVLLILGSNDVRNFAFNPAWWVTRKLLESRRLLRVEVLPYKDHSLESLAMRNMVGEVLRSWIAERFERPQPTESNVEAV